MPQTRATGWVRAIVCVCVCVCSGTHLHLCVCEQADQCNREPPARPGAGCLCEHESMVIEASSHSLFVSMQNMKGKLMVEQQ